MAVLEVIFCGCSEDRRPGFAARSPRGRESPGESLTFGDGCILSQRRLQVTSEQTVRQGFTRSVRDNAVGEVAVQLTRVAGVIYLARHLEPSDFGLYRMLLVISALVTLTIEAGIPEALIQRKDLGEEHEATAWWISCAIGIASAALLYRFAPLIGRLLAMPRLDSARLRLLCLSR